MDCEDLSALTDEDSKAILNDAFIEGKETVDRDILHAISGKYTLHTHSMVVNVLTCRKGGMEILKELFPKALLVPYATPGWNLPKLILMPIKIQQMTIIKVFDIVFYRTMVLL